MMDFHAHFCSGLWFTSNSFALSTDKQECSGDNLYTVTSGWETRNRLHFVLFSKTKKKKKGFGVDRTPSPEICPWDKQTRPVQSDETKYCLFFSEQ